MFYKKERLCLEIKTLSWSRVQSNESERKANLRYSCFPSPGPAQCPDRLWSLEQAELKQGLEVISQVRIFRLELLIFDSTSSPAPQWLKTQLHSGMNVHFYNGQFWINWTHEKCLFGVKLCNVSLISIPKSQSSVFHSGQDTKALCNSQASFWQTVLLSTFFFFFLFWSFRI